MTQSDSSFSFAVSGFNDPDGDPIDLSARLHSGEPLPNWITFSPTDARFSMTPYLSSPGTYLVDATAVDPYGANATVTTSLDVLTPPVVDITTSTDSNATLKQALSAAVPVASGTGLVMLVILLLMWRHRRIQTTNAHVMSWSARYRALGREGRWQLVTARAVSMTLPLPVAVPPMTGTASLAGSAEFRIESESQSRFRGYMPFSMVQSRLQALLDALGNADNDESVLKAYDSFEVAAFAFDWSHVTGNRAGGRLTGTPQAGFKLESESDSEAGCSGDLPASRVATVGLPGRRDVTFTSLPVVSVIVALADAITTSALEVQLPIQDHDGPAAAYYRSANDPGRRMAASESGESEGNATVAASGDDTGTNLKLEGATAPTTTRTMGGHGQDGIGSDGNGVSPASATVMVVGRGPGTSGDQSATRTQTSSTRLAAAGLGDFEHVGNGVVVRPQCLWAAVLLRRFTRLALAAHCGVGHRTAQAAKSRMLDVLDALLARLPMTPTKPLTAKLVFELLCAREAVVTPPVARPGVPRHCSSCKSLLQRTRTGDSESVWPT